MTGEIKYSIFLKETAYKYPFSRKRNYYLKVITVYMINCSPVNRRYPQRIEN